MRAVKRTFGYLVVAAAAALLFLELTHWGDKRLDLISENTAVNLRQEPAAAITEEERTMMNTLFEVPVIRQLLESGEGGDITAADDSAVMAAVDECLAPEIAVTATASVLAHEDEAVLLASWSIDRDKRVLLQKTGGDEAEYFKVYSRGGLFGTRWTYENWDNERVRKSLVHHWWFSWLTPRE